MNRTSPHRLLETAEAKRIEAALLKLMSNGQTLGKLFIFPKKTLAKAKDLSEEDRYSGEFIRSGSFPEYGRSLFCLPLPPSLSNSQP